MKMFETLVNKIGTKQSVKIGNNTTARLITEQKTDSTGKHPRIVQGVAIRLHSTDVVTLWEDGSVTLNSGGWQTATTKSRMNEYAEPFYVSQKKGVWWVSQYLGDGKHSAPFPFWDGMILTPTKS